MAMYYYNKYNVVSDTTYTQNPSWSSWGMNGNWEEVRIPLNRLQDYYPSYGFSTSLGYTVSGTPVRRYAGDSPPVGYYIYWNGSFLFRVDSGTIAIGGETYARSSYLHAGSTTTYSRGTLVQSNIIAEEGTYPTNGRHTDGYWYVRGAVVITFPELKIRINGALKTSEKGWVRINGQLKEIDKMWTKINGSLKEV